MSFLKKDQYIKFALLALWPGFGHAETVFIGTSGNIDQSAISPGDTIFFTGGVQYNVNLDLNQVGSEDAAIVITSTGKSRAIISADDSYGLHLKNCTNIIVKDLIFKGKGRLNGNYGNGVIIENCRLVSADNLEISGFQHTGLLINGSSNHISITGIYTYDNGFAGIAVQGKWPEKYQCRNIYIGHCKVENNPGDPTILDNHSGNGIIVGACDSVLIEYCEALENGWDMPRKGNGPVGIWAWHADHVIIQYCIAHHNKTSPGAADGGGFDLDGGVTNSMIQYCLSYENEGAGFGLFEYVTADPWNNNTLRYNISINDGIKNGNCGIIVWNGEMDSELLGDAMIHNNVFYNDRNEGAAVWFFDPYYRDLKFVNNIFLTSGPALKGDADIASYYGNVYWNLGKPFSLRGYDSFPEWAAAGHEMLWDSMVGMNLDPLLIDPGPVGLTNPDSINFETLSGFGLQEGSPVIDRGLDLQSVFGIDPGQQDLFGYSIPAGSGFDPGVHEFQPLTSTGASFNPQPLSGKTDQCSDWISLSPNPVENHMVHLQIKDPWAVDKLRIIVTDIHGRVLQSEVLHASGETLTFQVSGENQGGSVYFITIRSKAGSKTFKVII